MDEYREISKLTHRYNVLTPEQEIEVCQRIAKGCQKSKDLLICSNIRLVLSIANRYAPRIKNFGSVTYADLVSIGLIGLMTAANKFDLKKGCKFSTYATWWIRQSISRGAAESSTIRIPVHMIEKMTKFKRFRAQFLSEFQKEPKTSDYAAHFEMSEEDVRYVQTQFRKTVPMSLDTHQRDDEGINMYDLIPDEHLDLWSDIELQDLTKTIDKILNNLRSKDREIFELTYGLNGREPVSAVRLGQEVGINERKRAIRRARMMFKMQAKKKKLDTIFESNPCRSNESHWDYVNSILNVIQKMKVQGEVWDILDIAKMSKSPMDWYDRYSVCRARYDEAKRMIA